MNQREPTYDELRDSLRGIRDQARRSAKSLEAGPTPRPGVGTLRDIAMEADAALGENTAFETPEEK